MFSTRRKTAPCVSYRFTFIKNAAFYHVVSYHIIRLWKLVHPFIVLRSKLPNCFFAPFYCSVGQQAYDSIFSRLYLVLWKIHSRISSIIDYIYIHWSFPLTICFVVAVGLEHTHICFPIYVTLIYSYVLVYYVSFP